MGEKIKSSLFNLWIILSTIIVLSSIAFIFIYIIKNGAGSINLEFILGKPKGIPLGSEGGILPAIVGSLLLTLIACIFATVLAISTAIYVVFYCNSKRIEGIVHVIVQCMAGVPSIVLGLFGYTLLVVNLKLGRSLLSGGITLGIMIFPFIQVRVEKTLREISTSLINSSYALGVSKSYTLFKLVLPMCKSDIVSAITLAGGFAMGAAAPIILTAAVIFAPIPESLSSPVMALPFHLYILTGEGISLEKSYATALVLIMLLFIINLLSLLTLNRKYNRNI
ncbi:putative ABC transporter permease protein yqgI [Proteiniborus sp. DW1]|uniref:PstA family ABC transporter permease n=1 Tax=Proteiniborus sp. DW1 TaxID=1889883 RepID=UPI00092E0CCC|nr:ABC transporter permease subunit [Proteiniborus sp. DW1]SCG81836.1 putative ABC transporter permease protein yqgI [Proteiniborus sp. DW1]